MRVKVFVASFHEEWTTDPVERINRCATLQDCSTCVNHRGLYLFTSSYKFATSNTMGPLLPSTRSEQITKGVQKGCSHYYLAV